MIRRLLAFAILPVLLAGCATKRDLRDLQAEVVQLQAAQDRTLRELLQRNLAILDSMSIQNVRLRGDFTNYLVQIERQLVQIQELTGQGQQRLAELREELRAREEALRNAQAAAAISVEAGDPDELFATAEGALERGSISTARAGFEEFLRAFPQDPRVPGVRLIMGAILVQEDEAEAALEEYSRVLELHPDTPEAATALFQAALIERDRGNADRARSMLNQLTAAYPGSPEAAEALKELGRM